VGAYGTPDLGNGSKNIYEVVKCKKCGREYFKNWGRCPVCKTKAGSGRAGRIIGVILLALILIAAYGRTHRVPNSIVPSASASAPETSVTFSQPVVAAPKTGVYQLFVTKDLISQLEVRTDKSLGYHFVKLVDAANGAPVMTIFINKGETAKVKVPLGNYEMLFATGDTWYGDQYLFGPSTQYSKADKVYPFAINASGEIGGWTVDLTPQVNGNLHMKNISDSEWK